MLQPTQVIEPVVEGLLDRFGEGFLGIDALEFQESSHLPDGSSRRAFLEFFHIVIQPLGVSKETLFLFAWTAVSFLAIEGGMVSFGGAPGLSLVEEPFVIGHLLFTTIMRQGV